MTRRLMGPALLLGAVMNLACGGAPATLHDAGSGGAGGAGGAAGTAGGSGGAGAGGGAGAAGTGGAAGAGGGALKALGAACSQAAECGSAQCVQGMCCESACTGGCEACAQADTGAPNGQCRPRTSGSQCRASAGACDVAEVCDGLARDCPTDGFAGASVTCRASAGGCDVAEACTGSAAACPADTFAPSSTVCRASAGACDVAEACTGTSAACPADTLAPTSTVCRASAGGCDVAEVCSGTSAACPVDTFAPSSTVCRASAGGCDVAEACTGTSAACPADTFAPTSTVCRASAGVCDVAEACTGSAAACPADTFAPSSTVCRAAAGVCDVAEACTGTSAACPGDALADGGRVCRVATGPCDVAEQCSGTSVTCGADVLAPATTVGPCDMYRCTGASAACTTTCSQNADCSPDPHAVCVAGRCVRGRLAFVTSTTQVSNFGGLPGALRICSSLAADAGLSGRFDAWLSAADAGTPSQRFQRDGGPWIRPGDKVVVATDWTDLITQSGNALLQAPIVKTERGVDAPAGSRDTFTGTYADGTALASGLAATNCSNWMGLGSQVNSVVGRADLTNGSWSNLTTYPCTTPLRLYCFEQ